MTVSSLGYDGAEAVRRSEEEWNLLSFFFCRSAGQFKSKVIMRRSLRLIYAVILCRIISCYVISCYVMSCDNIIVNRCIQFDKQQAILSILF